MRAPVGGGLFVGCSSGTPGEEGEERKQALEGTRENSSAALRVHPDVAQALEAGKTVLGVLHLRKSPSSLADLIGEQTGSAGVSAEGELVEGLLNGEPADDAAFARAADDIRSAASIRYRESLDERRSMWMALAQRFELFDSLSDAISQGTSSATIELQPALAEAIVSASPVELRAIGQYSEGSPGLTSGLASMKLSTIAHPAGWRGDGLGIFVTEGGRPWAFTSDCVDTNRLTVLSGTLSPFAEHPELVVCLAQAAVPGAEVYYRTFYGACGSDFPPDLLTSNPPAYVSTQSHGWFGSRDYEPCDADFDDLILSTRIAHFQLAHNDGGNVRSPAVAYNVLAIGALDDEASPDEVASFSNYVDPKTLAFKPELVAPGVHVDVSPDFQDQGGTSVATPLAAGFATALMEQRSWLRGRPALLRAYLMANAVRVDSDGILVGDRDGYGRLDYGIAQFGKAYWWDGSNGSFFTQDTDGDGRKEIVVVYNLTSTGTYHAVISWLVDGSYAEQTLRPNMDLDLSVRAPNGTSLGHSVSAVQNHEGVRFTTSSTGNHSPRQGTIRSSLSGISIAARGMCRSGSSFASVRRST